MKKKLPGMGIAALVLAGLLILFYPTLSDWYNRRFQINAITEYERGISEAQQEALELERVNAERYNNALSGKDIEDPFVPGSGTALPDNYLSILDIYDGIMGYIDIPAVNIHLPIYHGTGDFALENGVGHMEMTAFPIGGEGNHSVLTGHTGLPGAKLFTDVRDLELGNLFFIKVLGETLAYEIDTILVIEPTDTSHLRPVKGEDYVTLVTCTPYGVNTHRLLLRGHRVEYTPEIAAESGHMQPVTKSLSYNLVISITALALVLLVVLVGVVRQYKKRQRKKRRGRRKQGGNR